MIMFLLIRRWIFRCIFDRQERIMINDIMALAYANHVKKRTWTKDTVKEVLHIEKIIRSRSIKSYFVIFKNKRRKY